MASTATAILSADAHMNVDLSQLISFSMGFKNLELVISSILARLGNIESNQAAHADANQHDFDRCNSRSDELTDGLQDLKGAVQEQGDIQRGLAQRCDDLEALMKSLSDRVDRSAAATVPTTSAVTNLGNGKDYGDDIDALRKAVEDLDTRKEDKHNKDNDSLAALEKKLNAAVKELEDLKASVEGVADRCAANERRVEDADRQSRARDDDLEKRIGQLHATNADHTKVAPPRPSGDNNNNNWVEPVNTLRNNVLQLSGDVDALNNKMAALAGMNHGSETPSEVTMAQFILLKAGVEALEKRPLAKDYDEAIRSLNQGMEKLNQEVRTLGAECSSNAAECKRLEDKKANKADLDALSGRVDAAGKKISPAPAAVAAAAPAPLATTPRSDDIRDLNRRLDELQRAMGIVDGRVRTVETDKTDRPVTQGLQDDIAALKKRLQALEAGGSGKSAGGDSPGLSQAEKAVVTEMQKQVGTLLEETSKNFDWTKGQVLEIRATIEHIHHTKADTSLVANKAEREFVENAMDKLMREVEQVLNATNAGLIDTLDKSLNILRDMIDGKATKQDVVKLQTMIGEDQIGSVPEGLTGFKGYRCLGCNRTLEGMRQRPMGANFATFMNRLPNGARNPAVGASSPVHPSSAQGPRVSGPSPPAGYIANTPQSH